MHTDLKGRSVRRNHSLSFFFFFFLELRQTLITRLSVHRSRSKDRYSVCSERQTGTVVYDIDSIAIITGIMKLGLRLNEGRADRPVSGAQLATALHGADNAALEVAFAKTIDLRQHCVRSSSRISFNFFDHQVGDPFNWSRGNAFIVISRKIIALKSGSSFARGKVKISAHQR